MFKLILMYLVLIIPVILGILKLIDYAKKLKTKIKINYSTKVYAHDTPEGEVSKLYLKVSIINSSLDIAKINAVFIETFKNILFWKYNLKTVKKIESKQIRIKAKDSYELGYIDLNETQLNYESLFQSIAKTKNSFYTISVKTSEHKKIYAKKSKLIKK